MPYKDLEKRRAHNREYARTHKAKHRINSLNNAIKRSGWTIGRHKYFMDAQGGGCAICRCVPPLPIAGKCRNKNVLCADHDHSTNEPRALLCHRCNVALGLLDDSADRLEIAAEYIRYWKRIRLSASQLHEDKPE